MTAERIYLDHNATTPVRPEVAGAMAQWTYGLCGNPSSLHSFGREARVAVEEAREKVAALIGARPEEIIFTSGGTEADNLALKGVVDAQKEASRTHVIVSAAEHEAVLKAAEYLREYRGCEVTYLPVDRHGVVSPEAVVGAITERTALVSVMHSNNETGTLQPVREIARICRARGVPFHTDAVQSAGKVPMDVEELGADLLSLSAHKMYGPKGVGALYVRRGVPFVPQMHGGAHEQNRRAGTENVAGIVGFGVAAHLAKVELPKTMAHLTRLRDELERRIVEAIPDVQVNGHPTERLPGTLNVSFAKVEGESIPIALDLEGIAVSAGSACASGAFRPSHVLLAMGLSEEMARAAVRFSFGRGNTFDEIPRVVEALSEVIARLRSFDARGEP